MVGSLENSVFFETLGCGISFFVIVGIVKTEAVSLLMLIFIALKKSFDTTDAENTLFGSSDHLQFEADSYLNLFNNDATRTYDHLKVYNKNLQYQWIKTAKNAREIYTAFADLFYLIYQKNPNASYYFLTTIHANSYKESLAIVTSKYPDARAYISKKAKEIWFNWQSH